MTPIAIVFHSGHDLRHAARQGPGFLTSESCTRAIVMTENPA
jgi:hypothetical protein